jgi:hypothetical protein
MRVKRIGWAGTRTSEYPAMVAFLQRVLGLTTSQEGSDFAAFQLPEGGTFEVSGPRLACIGATPAPTFDPPRRPLGCHHAHCW